MAGTTIVPRATVELIVGYRDQALALYDEAFTKIAEAAEAVAKAHKMVELAAPLGSDNYVYDRTDEINAFYKAVRLPDAGQYRRVARKLTDLRCWGHIVKMTDLERLMDTQAKQQLRDQMRYVPDRVDRRGQLITEEEADKGLPPITVDNVYATIEQFRADAGMIFRRGIANVFSELDRRFRSHDGFKIGGRIIVTRMFNENGSLEWGRTRDTLIDIERVFCVLDSMDKAAEGDEEGAKARAEASFQSTLWQIENERRDCYNARQSEHENEFFKVRCFKNGNAHLWFRRDDLVRKVNKLLAEYYGEVIADGQTAEDDPLENRKTTPARYYGFFPTPEAAAREMFDGRGWRTGIIVLRLKEEPQMRILEPSAGTGNLARRCIKTVEHAGKYAADYRFDNLVDCVEIQPALAEGLKAEGIYNRVICADFLSLRPELFAPYDLIIMNPPFDRERDIDHVTHALKFLKPGGTLHAIMSAGTEFRETRKAIAFRALVEKVGGSFRDLPPASFAEVGTYVNTVVLSLRVAA